MASRRRSFRRAKDTKAVHPPLSNGSWSKLDGGPSVHRPVGLISQKKCRPDWDITTPELEVAWEQGRKELFYPYGKTYVQTIGEQD
jgi:hypothetical protein